MKLLKKIDVRLYFLIFIGFLTFSITTNVFAGTNYNTTFNFSIPNYDNILKTRTCGNVNTKDFVHDFIDSFEQNYSNDYVLNVALYNNNTIDITPNDVNVDYGDYDIKFSIFPKAYNTRNRVNFWVAENYSSTFDKYYYSNQMRRFFTGNARNIYIFSLDIDSCNSSPYLMNTYQSMMTLLNSGTFSSSSNNSSRFYSTNDFYIQYGDFYSNLNLSDNTDLDLDMANAWVYYSSVPINFNQDGCQGYCKALHIDNTHTTYYLQDVVPTFWNIKDTFPSDDYVPLDVGNSDKLKSIYTNFPSNQYSNFDLTIELDKNNSNINGYDYGRNYINNELCRGRVNHNDNYYTYEYLDCTYERDISYSNNHVIIEYYNLQFFNNGVEITDLSRYDKLFLTLPNSLNDSNIDMSATNITIDFPIGNVIMNDYLGSIYDNFDNLPLLFKFYLSSNQSNLFDVYSRYTLPPLYSSGYVFWNQYNTNSLTPTTLVGNITTNFTKVSVSNSINSAIMIYQNDANVLIPKIEFIFDKDLVISYADTSSNSFYYIDSTDTIQNNNIQVNYDNVPSNNYDISFYVDKVNSFINDLADDSAELGSLTQQLYDGLPLIFQTFIFVIFILFNIYFVYLMIRK